MKIKEPHELTMTDIQPLIDTLVQERLAKLEYSGKDMQQYLQIICDNIFHHMEKNKIPASCEEFTKSHMEDLFFYASC